MADDTTDEEPKDLTDAADKGPDDDDLDEGEAGESDKSDKSDESSSESGGDDTDDDDDDLVDDDDVEADLDRILKDRMVTAEEEDEAEANEPEDRSGAGGRLQPKQQDEQLCSTCFLLVRSNAPNCPIGDEDCPIFS